MLGSSSVASKLKCRMADGVSPPALKQLVLAFSADTLRHLKTPAKHAYAVSQIFGCIMLHDSSVLP